MYLKWDEALTDKNMTQYYYYNKIKIKAVFTNMKNIQNNTQTCTLLHVVMHCGIPKIVPQIPLHQVT